MDLQVNSIGVSAFVVGTLLAVYLSLFPVAAISDRLAGIAFSAETYQRTPQKAQKQGRIFVQGSYVRTEVTDENNTEVRIYDIKQGAGFLIDGKHRQYAELPGHAIPRQIVFQGKDANPCEGFEKAQCKRRGSANISGREAVEWDIVISQGAKKQQIRQWVDAERGNVLRYLSDTGEYSDNRLVQQETLDGRRVEKWEVVSSDGVNSPQKSYSWFDPELNLVIKEEYPGGYVRGMRKIRVQPQSPQLFVIPEGYRKVESDRSAESQ